jgi:hypothetical protein
MPFLLVVDKALITTKAKENLDTCHRRLGHPRREITVSAAKHLRINKISQEKDSNLVSKSEVTGNRKSISDIWFLS